ncbi:hypothetical protein BBJ28_00023058, partial [Nothophytophthora sp. Chile5]
MQSPPLRSKQGFDIELGPSVMADASLYSRNPYRALLFQLGKLEVQEVVNIVAGGVTRSRSKMNIVEQVPCTPSERTKGQAIYAIEKTPHDVADLFETGALREGSTPNVWSRQHIGLLMQYAAVGMVHGTLPGTVYPFFLNYLNMEGTQVVSARVLLNLPWSFKVFYGLLSDCAPIFGYRRRPFMLIGWAVCFFMLLVMACMDAGDPYYPDRKYAHVNPATLNPEIVATFNTSARQNGTKFIVAMMLAAVGFVAVDAAADAVVVELAQREPEAVRGTTQTTIYMVRTIFVTLSAVLTGFAFNGKDYGGDFDFSISFPQLMSILCLCCLPVLPITWFFIKEEKHAGVNVREYMASFWELLQQQPVYQVIAYSFFSGIFAKFTATCLEPMQATWAGTTPFNDKVMETAGHAIFALMIFCTGKYGLHWNWRLMVFITAVAVVVLDSMATLLTTWDVVRNQWFWLGVGVAE